MKRQSEKIIQNVRGRLEPRARLGGLGKYDVAEKLLLQTRDIQSRLLGPDSPRTADTTYNLACLAVRRGRRDEAFSFLRGGYPAWPIARAGGGNGNGSGLEIASWRHAL